MRSEPDGFFATHQTGKLLSAARSVGMTRAAIRAATPATLIGSGAEIKAIDIALATYLFRNPATATNVVLLNDSNRNRILQPNWIKG